MRINYLLVLALAFLFSAAGYTQNLIQNPGFEDGEGNNFPNYNIINQINGAFSEGTAQGEYLSGGRGLVGTVTMEGNAWGLQMSTDRIPTQVGEEYTFSVWVKGATADTQIRFSTMPSPSYSPNLTVSADWTQLSWTFRATEPMTSVVLDIGEQINTYHLDDMSLQGPPPGTASCAVPANGSFETFDAGSGLFSGWVYYNQNNGSSFGVTMDEDDVYEGGKALVANSAAGSQSFDLQIASPDFYTLEGATYQLTAWVKADRADANTIQFSTREAADPFSTEDQFTTTPAPIGDDWTEVSYQFVASSARTLVTLNMGGDTENTFYIDGVCVEAVCGTEDTTPADQEPIATGKEKFLGNIYAGHALPGFERYFNQVTPENSGKWGSVEAERDVFNWSQLDAARAFAREKNFPFRFHVMIWGSQQPEWLADLTPEEQLQEILEWFEAVSTRYRGEDAPEYVEVVNEPLNAPPSYREALTSLNEELGTEPWEFDWVTNGFKLARRYFPAESQLMINEFGLANTADLTDTYVGIVERLIEDDLIDAVGMQGHTFSTKLYGGSYRGLNNLLRRNLEELAGTGLPVMVTEMDIEGDMFFASNGLPQDGGTQEQKDSFQLAEYQRIFELYWNHPSVIGITLWGWRPGLWQNDAEAYLTDPCTGQPRPALTYLNTVIRASNPQINISTDVDEANRPPSTFRVYPTVTTSELTLEGLPRNSGPIRIFTLSGQLMQTVHPTLVQGERINLQLRDDLPAGLYLIQNGNSARKFIRR